MVSKFLLNNILKSWLAGHLTHSLHANVGSGGGRASIYIGSERLQEPRKARKIMENRPKTLEKR